MSKEVLLVRRRLEGIPRPFHSDPFMLNVQGRSAYLVDASFGLRLFRGSTQFLTIEGHPLLYLRRSSIDNILSTPTDKTTHGDTAAFLFNMRGTNIPADIYVGEWYRLESKDVGYGRILMTVHAPEPPVIERVDKSALQKELAGKIANLEPFLTSRRLLLKSS